VSKADFSTRKLHFKLHTHRTLGGEHTRSKEKALRPRDRRGLGRARDAMKRAVAAVKLYLGGSRRPEDRELT
jgi:hypothetical protein